MKRIILPAIAMGFLTLASCSGGKLDTNSLGNMVGGNYGHMIKAGGHEINAITLSESDEPALGQSVGLSVTNTYPVLKNDALTKYVTLVGFTLASTQNDSNLRCVFGILDTPEVNAFSGPHGYIFITRGALAAMKDEAELAGVLGHEMSHVMLHHGLNQVRAAEQEAGFSEAIQSSSRAAQFSALADRGVEAITKVGYTQKQEFEADQNSVKLVSAAGYNPASFLHFLKRIAPMQSGGVMSTHPGGAERVSRITEQLETVPRTGATLADRFKQNVNL